MSTDLWNLRRFLLIVLVVCTVYTCTGMCKVLCADIVQLKTHYHTVLRLMPESYEQSVGKLQNYISDDQICMILSSSSPSAANKIILDSLIERINCKEELLDLCHQLETIATSQQLKTVISEIRSGEW